MKSATKIAKLLDKIERKNQRNQKTFCVKVHDKAIVLKASCVEEARCLILDRVRVFEKMTDNELLTAFRAITHNMKELQSGEALTLKVQRH